MLWVVLECLARMCVVVVYNSWSVWQLSMLLMCVVVIIVVHFNVMLCVVLQSLVML